MATELPGNAMLGGTFGELPLMVVIFAMATLLLFMVSRRPAHKVSGGSRKCSENKDGSVAFLECVEQIMCKNTACKQDGAAVSKVDRDIEPVVPSIGMEISPAVCSSDACDSTNPWGCADHARYSKELLLAHHAWSMRIARGPPGLVPCREPEPTPSPLRAVSSSRSLKVSCVTLPSLSTPPGLAHCDKIMTSASSAAPTTKAVDASLTCPPGLALPPASACPRSAVCSTSIPSKAYTVNHMASLQPIKEDCIFRVIGPVCLTVKVDTVQGAYVVASTGAQVTEFRWDAAGVRAAWTAMCNNVTTRCSQSKVLDTRFDAPWQRSRREEV